MYRLDIQTPHAVFAELFLRYALEFANMTVVGLLPCEIGHVTVRPTNDGLCVGQGECVYFGCASFISLIARTSHSCQQTIPGSLFTLESKWQCREALMKRRGIACGKHHNNGLLARTLLPLDVCD
jgi:hypothetical protein